MDYKNIAYLFVNKFKEYNTTLQEHIEYNGEILNHVFFGECSEQFIILIEEETNVEGIQELFEFFEKMASCGDQDVQDLLQVTVLESFWDENKILTRAEKLMGPQTKLINNNISDYLGRPS